MLIPRTFIIDKTIVAGIILLDFKGIIAKIKLSTIPGACAVDNVMQNEVIFYDGSLTNMDELLVQLVDFEGKILELTKDHNFTLVIVEKIEFHQQLAID